MRILYLAHRTPFPPNKGDKLRAFRQIERLARNHELWCAFFVDNSQDERHADSLRAHCKEVAPIRLRPSLATLKGLYGLAMGGTVTESFYANRNMNVILQQWALAKNFDAVVAFSSSMAQYAGIIPAKRYVLDLCDLDSRKWADYAKRSPAPLRWVYQLEAHRLSKKEVDWIDVFDTTLLITDFEADDLPAKTSRNKVTIVTNGVDLNVGRAPTIEATSLDMPEGHDQNLMVGFAGVMNYRPNVDGVVWFANNCWPAIRRAFPGATFRILGRHPKRRVRRLGRHPGIEVTGEVHDMQAHIRRLDVSVAPLQTARGLQNKVLEAMAARKPVVLTTPAARGISAKPGQDYCVADTPTSFAADVIRLLRTPRERNRIGNNAGRFVACHHRWSNVLDRFEQVVTGVVQKAVPADPSVTGTGDHASTHLTDSARSMFDTRRHG